MPKTQAGQTYSELSVQLDEIMDKLRDPDVSIDSAAVYYEQALMTIEKLEKLLMEAENTVREIKGQFAGE